MVVDRIPLAALVGNPNAGKTSVFNALTGARQKIGNYPGVTVEKVSGTIHSAGLDIEIIDVPGLYSLQAVSMDEQVAADSLHHPDLLPDVLVYVLDATNLERNLFLYSQVVEENLPVVIALTMTDLLTKENRTVDIAKLQSSLGTTVVAVVPHKGDGIPSLVDEIRDMIGDPVVPEIGLGFPVVVTDAAQGLVNLFSRSGVELSSREARCVILEENCATYQRFRNNPELTSAIDEARHAVLGASGQGKTIDSQTRYAWAAKVKKDCINQIGPKTRSNSSKIDAVLTHRFFGLVIFVAIMFTVFESIYTLAKPLMSLIDFGISFLTGAVKPLLASTPVLQSLVVDGLIKGVGSVLAFLPQIIILFFFIAVLEGTGYLSRAAFLMDRLLGWCGLNGRAFIPLLSSFACAIPGILSARVMPDARSRLATVLVAPLMSCSARLPVYVLMIGAIIEPKFGPAWAGFALFAMHFVGLAVAIPVVYILNRGILKGKRLPFMLELPKYQWPKWRDVSLTIMSRVKVFMTTAGTIIVAMSIIIWASLYFPRGDAKAYHGEYIRLSATRQADVTEASYLKERQRQDSLLGQFGKWLEPAFAPAGFDWRLTTAILAAFPAREVVVPALGILFERGDSVDESSGDLRIALQQARWPDSRPLLTPWTAVSLMVFFALCCQCMATLATIRRETNSWKWPLFAFTYMTVIAYLASVAIQSVGRIFNP